MDCHTPTETAMKDFHILSYHEYVLIFNSEYPELWEIIRSNTHKEGQFFDILTYFNPKFKEFLEDFYVLCDKSVNEEYYQLNNNSFFDIYIEPVSTSSLEIMKINMKIGLI